MYDLGLLFVTDRCECQGRSFGGPFGDDDVTLLLFVFGFMGTEGFVELNDLSFDRVLLLEEGIDFELPLFGESILFFEICGIDKDFRVDHGARADHAAMVSEGGELVFLNIFVDGFLDVKVFAHK